MPTSRAPRTSAFRRSPTNSACSAGTPASPGGQRRAAGLLLALRGNPPGGESRLAVRARGSGPGGARGGAAPPRPAPDARLDELVLPPPVHQRVTPVEEDRLQH